MLQKFEMATDQNDLMLPALQLLFRDGWERRLPATHYRKMEGKKLTLFWTAEWDSGLTPLPIPLKTPEDVANFFKGWLESEQPEPPGEDYPDTDGSAEIGWKISSGESRFTISAEIEPVWVEYAQ